MPKNELVIRSSCLATREKLPEKILATGKIHLSLPDQFLFYLIEIATPWTSGQKIKKAIVETLEKNATYDDAFDEERFEKLLTQTNESLSRIVSGGEASWIGNLNAVIGLVDRNQISLAQTGRISGYLFRKGKISTLADSSPTLETPHPLKTFSDITSGQFVAEDRVVIGNTELYNHLSLDRIRRATEGLSAPEFIFELSKTLKKGKIFSANVFAIEAIDKNVAEELPLTDFPEIIYLDQPEENVLKHLNKKYGPKLRLALNTSGHHLTKAGSYLSKTSKEGYRKAHLSWQEKYGPKTKDFIKKSAPALAKALKSTKDSVAPQIDKFKQDKHFRQFKIKTRNYAHNPNSPFGKILSVVIDFVLVLKNWAARKESRKYLLLILIVILISVGYFKISANSQNNNSAKNQQEIALAYDQAKESYAKAKENLALGKATGSGELENALTLANKAKESETNKEAATKLARQIQADLDTINKTVRIYSDLAGSFSTPEKSILASQIGSTIYIFCTYGKVYSANSGDSVAKLIASIGKADGEPISLTNSPTGSEIFIYTSNKKVISFDTKSNTATNLSTTDSSEWEDATGIAAFSSNIYLLDKQSGNIQKHSKSDSGYSAASSYIGAKKDYAKDALGLAIDGNVYVLMGDGSVNKFSKGSKDSSFSLQAVAGTNAKIEEPEKIYTADDTNYIYVLDKKFNRIVKFDKSGQFVKSYALDGSPIIDFTINEKLKKIWLVSEEKIIEADL